MGKFLLLVVLLVFVFVIAGLRAKKNAQNAHHDHDENAPKMLRCHFCGVHFPETDAVKVGAKIFCCDSHADISHKP